MTIDPAVRYEGISPKAYEHPADRAATAALRSIPLMDQFVRRLCDFGHERRMRQVLLGNAVRIGEDQVPQLWGSYTHCVRVLDLEDTPDLYVTQTPLANAMTVGAQNPVVIVYSSLVGSYEPLEVRAVLAHELGHVLSEHYTYTTALVILTQVVQGAPSRSPVRGPPPSAPCIWQRARMVEDGGALERPRSPPSPRARGPSAGHVPDVLPCPHCGRGASRGMRPRRRLHPSGHRVRGGGRPLLPPRPLLGGDRPTAPLRRPACRPTREMGQRRRVRPHPGRALRAPGAGASHLG